MRARAGFVRVGRVEAESGRLRPVRPGAPRRAGPDRAPTTRPDAAWGRPRPGRPGKTRPELAAGLFGLVLAVAYLLAPPMGTDLSAQVAHADFFQRYGLTPVDLGWYGGTGQFGYSLVSPAVMALIGVRVTGAVALVVSVVAFAALLDRTRAPRPLLGALLGAVCFAGNLVSGRVTYALGVAFGLLGLLALTSARRWVRYAGGAAGALLAGATSPVAGLFVGLAAVALSLALAPLARLRRLRPGVFPRLRDSLRSPSGSVQTPAAAQSLALAPLARLRRLRPGVFPRLRDSLRSPSGSVQTPAAAPRPGADDRHNFGEVVTVMAAAAVPLGLTALLFGEGGWMNISPSDTTHAVVTGLAVALVVPLRPVRIGAVLAALGVLAAYLVHTPVGLNATRLATMFALPVVAAYALPRRHLAAGALAVAVALWQPPLLVEDLVDAGNPTAQRAYFAPLTAELQHREPVGRIEIPPTRDYWEAAYAVDAAPLARGWLRQLDLDRNPQFLDGTLTADGYRAWLRDNGVSYVAVADAEPSWVGRREADLIRAGQPFLTQVWRGGHWTLYEVDGPPSLAAGATVVASNRQAITVNVPASGDYLVRVRWSHRLTADGPDGAHLSRDGRWSRLRTAHAGRYTISSCGVSQLVV
jgi:hypothetical protein